VDESEVEGLGGLGPGVHEGRLIWRANPKIEPLGLDIGGTSREAPPGGGGDI
jgi:hypothetical protein